MYDLIDEDSEAHESKENERLTACKEVGPSLKHHQGDCGRPHKGPSAVHSIKARIRPKGQRGTVVSDRPAKVRLREYYRYEVADLEEVNRFRIESGLPPYKRLKTLCKGCEKEFFGYFEVLKSFLRRVSFYCYYCKRGID